MIHLHGTQSVAFRVLIVDEDAVQSEIVARCVEMLGWTQDTASGPDEAARKFNARRHNVVIISLDSENPDSHELLRCLRTDYADPVVIFIARSRDRIRGTEAGAARELGLRVAGTLLKPIDPYRLHALLLSNPSRPLGEQKRTAPQPTADDLDRALRAGEIHTEYQPKSDLVTGEIVGMEALARWVSPIFGLIPPDQFVPVAEQSDLISRLTFQVLADAMAACRRWRLVRPTCGVAVNLSPHVLANPGLLPMIDSLLAENQLRPDALIAEITETTFLANMPAATETLTRLSLKGVLVSIDDFGTGYSSVSSLMRMPFTELKIDRSFVSACRTDPQAWKMVRASVSLARELGIKVVAEGIETEDISDRLRDVGCDTGQGWYYGRPMQEKAMLSWLGLIRDARDAARAAPQVPGETAAALQS